MLLTPAQDGILGPGWWGHEHCMHPTDSKSLILSVPRSLPLSVRAFIPPTTHVGTATMHWCTPYVSMPGPNGGKGLPETLASASRVVWS